VAAVGGGVWLSQRDAGTAGTTYLTGRVQRGEVVQTVAATATVQARNNWVLQFPTTGPGTGTAVVRAVTATVGQRVAAGTELATLDDTTQTSQLAAARAQLDSAQTALSADQDAGFSDSRISSDRAAVAAATSDVAQAKSAVAAIRIAAPAAGVITAVRISAGAPPPAGAAVELRSETLVVAAEVAEQDVAAVKAKQVAQLTFPALGAVSTGTVSSLPASATPVTSGSGAAVTFPVTLTMQKPPAGLLPGMSVQVSITIARHTDVLTVPTTAIQGSAAGPRVQVLVAGVPQTRTVTIGLSTEQTTEVVSGLAAGDVVVTGELNPTNNPVAPRSGVGSSRPGNPGGAGGSGGGRGGN
jgi:macrolide-specific efflux system membrane fusion protein